MNAPRVSVVMPARNEERFVAAAVRSILTQSLADLELIAIDDGSTDDTRAILDGLAREDARVRVMSGPGKGIAAALNVGVASARAAYVARMDADDVSLPARLERQAAELDRRPQLGVVGTGVAYVDADDVQIGTWDVPVGVRLVRWSLAFGTPLAHPTVMVRRDVLPDPPYRDDIPHVEDYDLWVRLAVVTELDNLRDTLLRRRVHGLSVSDRHTDLQGAGARLLQRRAIRLLADLDVTDDDVRTLVDARTIPDALRATRLIRRLYRRCGGGAELRRDAVRRVVMLFRRALSAT